MGAWWLVWTELVQDGLRQHSWKTKAGCSGPTHVTSLNGCLVARGLFQFMCMQAIYTVVLARVSIFTKMVVVVGELGRENASEIEKLEGWRNKLLS